MTKEEWSSYEIFSEAMQEEFDANSLSNLEFHFSTEKVWTGNDFIKECDYLEKFGIEDIDDIRSCNFGFSHDDGSRNAFECLILVQSNGEWGILDETMLYYIKNAVE
jgi:hypothetical protein